jgi:hypothetical protein
MKTLGSGLQYCNSGECRGEILNVSILRLYLFLLAEFGRKGNKAVGSALDTGQWQNLVEKVNAKK